MNRHWRDLIIIVTISLAISLAIGIPAVLASINLDKRQCAKLGQEFSYLHRCH